VIFINTPLSFREAVPSIAGFSVPCYPSMVAPVNIAMKNPQTLPTTSNPVLDKENF